MIFTVVVVGGLALAGCGGDDGGSPSDDETTQGQEPPAEGTEPAEGNQEPPAEAGGTDDVLAVAQGYVDAVNKGDEAAATEFMCDQTGPGSLFEIGGGEGDYIVDNPEIGENGIFATVDIGVTGSSTVGKVPLGLEKHENGWCIEL